MIDLEAILKEAGALSPAERSRLIVLLMEQTGQEHLADEIAVGCRGLAAWTESTSDESWSEFYPEVLRNDRGHST